MNWYLEVLKRYVEFGGRARRAEYWTFVLFNFIIGLVLALVDRMILGGHNILGAIYGLAVFLPSLGVSIRRLHDTGRSGLLLLLSFVPLVGAIILIIFMAQEGQPQENQYGPNPKQAW